MVDDGNYAQSDAVLSFAVVFSARPLGIVVGDVRTVLQNVNDIEHINAAGRHGFVGSRPRGKSKLILEDGSCCFEQFCLMYRRNAVFCQDTNSQG
jgi:hypothetical protein